MAYIKNNWVDREGTTRYFETVDDDGALIFTPDYTQVTELGTPVNADNMNHIEEGIGEHENRITVLENLPDKYLNKSQITNCITEIPQRIKYTLEDGTLTIKAGSVAIVPYSTEDLTAQYPKGATFLNDNFKVYDTQFEDGKFFVWAELVSDVSAKPLETSTNDRFVGLNLLTNIYVRNDRVSSGTGDASGNWVLHYSTDKNIVMTTNGSGEIIQTQYGTTSLPFLIATGDGVNSYGSIKQVFNGMGYIGSTVWVDKGVKGLIPNDRNEDGTLKNIEVSKNKLTIFSTSNFGANIDYQIWISSSGHAGATRSIGVCNVLPITVPDTYTWVVYNEEDNFWYRTSGSTTANWIKDLEFAVGKVSVNSDKNVSFFEPKQPFRALDYSDKSQISGWAMPSSKYINLTLGASGSNYTVPANGWVQVSKYTTAAGQDLHLSLISSAGWLVSDFKRAHASGNLLECFVPVFKGSEVRVGYSAAGETNAFKFIYAEGEV